METITHTCNDCGERVEDIRIVNEHHLREIDRPVCVDCYDDYTTCPECGTEVHSDDACPLYEPDSDGAYETYGCAPCAGYRHTMGGWVKA